MASKPFDKMKQLFPSIEMCFLFMITYFISTFSIMNNVITLEGGPFTSFLTPGN